jgi:hypothetical protein
MTLFRMCPEEDDENVMYFEEYFISLSRTPHVCCECGDDIFVGESYHKVRCVMKDPNKRFAKFHTCQFCYNTYEELFDTDYGRIFGKLWEFLGKHGVTIEQRRGLGPNSGS